MRKLFIILGSIAALLGLGLGLAGLFLIEEHRKEMNRRQTKPARNAKLGIIPKEENNTVITPEDVRQAQHKISDDDEK